MQVLKCLQQVTDFVRLAIFFITLHHYPHTTRDAVPAADIYQQIYHLVFSLFTVTAYLRANKRKLNRAQHEKHTRNH